MKIPFSNLFKKKEKPQAPAYSGVIRYTEQAKELGLFDDANRVIDLYKYGEKVETIPYSKEILNSLREIEEYAIVSEDFDDDAFNFIESADFGGVNYRR